MTVSRATKIIRFFDILNSIVVTGAAFVAVCLVALFFLMSRAPDPVDVKISIPDPKVKFGEFLEVEYDNDRHVICQTVTDISIFDKEGTKITFPGIPTNAVGRVGSEKTRRKILITHVMQNQEVLAGPARYRLALTWKCPGNYYQAVFPKTRVYEDVPFEILE